MRNIAIIAVILAIATSIWTWWPRQQATESAAGLEGTLLNASGKEISPENVASLRVVKWNTADKSPDVFEVAKKGGDWIIPSHFDYPADGGTRVGTTAGTVLNVPRGPLVTTDIKRHKELEVVDPLREGTAESEGCGKRVTLKDEGGAVLVDLIIGKKAEHADVYYVREAGGDSVFTADINPDIRTAFKDWVKTDMLEVNSSDIRSIAILDQSVDETRGVVRTRSQTYFQKESGATDWTSPQAPRGKEVNQDTVKKLTSEITGLKLVGVRPFSNLWLQSRGFYVTGDGTLVGNEGSVQVMTKDGLIHHLFFGEIALGDDEDTTAEIDDEQYKSTGGTHNRYMAVFVQYDPERDESLPDPDEQDEKGNGAPMSTPGGKEAEGFKKAERAQNRFGRFFYVISDDSFKKLRPPKNELFETPE